MLNLYPEDELPYSSVFNPWPRSSPAALYPTRRVCCFTEQLPGMNVSTTVNIKQLDAEKDHKNE